MRILLLASHLVALKTDIQVLSCCSTDSVNQYRSLTILDHGRNIVTSCKAVVGDHGADNGVPQHRHSMILRGHSAASGNVILSIMIRIHVHLFDCDVVTLQDASRIALGRIMTRCFLPTESDSFFCHSNPRFF